MKKTVAVGLGLIFLIVGFSFAGHEIAYWPEGRSGAVSLTFDDGRSDQQELIIPALNERGMSATFFIIVEGANGRRGPHLPWNYWVDTAKMGHEIGSHTKNHLHPNGLSGDKLADEVENSRFEIDEKIRTQQVFTFAYPFGELNANMKSLVGRNYIAARGTDCDLNFEPYNFYHLGACGDKANPERMKGLADLAEEESGWLNVYFHGFSETGDLWRMEQFEDFLDYLMDKDLWVGTLGGIAKYARERDSASLSVIGETSKKILIDLTHDLDWRFDEPLTIRSEVPRGWAYVEVTQGRQTTILKSFVEGSKRVIYYNARPNAGRISLKKIKIK